MQDIDTTIENLNFYYNMGIYEGAYFDIPGFSLGSRVYADSWNADIASNIFEISYDLNAYATVPKIDALVDYEEAEAAFDDIYNTNTTEAADHFDVMGEYWTSTTIVDDRDYASTGYNETFDAFTEVQFGYKVPSNTTEESIKIGILFSTEVPMEKAVYGDQLIQWAKYTQVDPTTGENTENSFAVACVSTIGYPESTEVFTYENVAPFEDLSTMVSVTDELDSYRVYDSSAWSADVTNNWEMYDLSYDNVLLENNSKQSCLAMQDWSQPDGTDLDYGWFTVTSGVRYVDS